MSLLFVSMDRVRARYEAAMAPHGGFGPSGPHGVEWLTRVLASVQDVPLLVAELARSRLAYADLLAACRAGLLARRDGASEEAAWRYITDELPPPPFGHPLHDPRPNDRPTERPTDESGGGASD